MSGIGIKHLAFAGYAVNDMTESRKFYGEILGLKEGMALDRDGETTWLEFDIPGGQTVAIVKASPQWQPSPNGGGICLELEDLDAAVATLEKAGVKFASPIQEFPVCRMALILDPSGNTIALHQKKPNHPECSH